MQAEMAEQRDELSIERATGAGRSRPGPRLPAARIALLRQTPGPDLSSFRHPTQTDTSLIANRVTHAYRNFENKSKIF
ncbi:unnamed protein product, partial [Iphiclides podalirius]